MRTDFFEIIKVSERLSPINFIRETKTYFNPGCALSIYKTEKEIKILKFLNDNYGDVALHKICCRHESQVDEGSLIIEITEIEGNEILPNLLKDKTTVGCIS